MSDFKQCPGCGAKKRTDEFRRNAARPDGLSFYCRVPHNERGRISHFSRTYGITAERVEQMIEGQGGLCPICRRDLGTRPHVDHDHETGQVRGILCFNCNGGLGQFSDDIGRLQQAVEYLEGNLQPSVRGAIEAEQRLLELLDRIGRAA